MKFNEFDGFIFCREYHTTEAHLCSERGLSGRSKGLFCSHCVFVPAEGNLQQLMDENMQRSYKKLPLDRTTSAPDNSRVKSCEEKREIFGNAS